MATVSFPFSVKYKGRWYAPSASFTADDSDLDKLTALGGKVSAQKPQEPVKASAANPAGKQVGRSAKKG